MWFAFRIPYFVGPLSEESEKNGGNGWIVRREEGKITPWNLEEKVNIPETIKKFIVRMIRDCTYLSEEKGLPKSSLLYQEYMVLNEVNNMKVAGVRVSKEIKNAIYSLYKEGNVTVSKIQKRLLEEGYISNKDEFFVEGEKLTAQLSSYTAIKQIIGDKISDRKTVEKFIFMSTVYGNEKSMLKKYAKKEFPMYSEEELNMLCRLNFKEWGNLSEKFLTMKGFCGTFIEIMEKTTQNLMEILYNHRYGFLDIVEAARPTYPDILDITYDDLNIYNMSGPVKRMVWQSIKQIQYIIRRTNAEPANIYIESTRSTEESERTVATKDMFIKKFKDIFKGEELQYWTDIVEKLDETGLLKTKKAYLFLTQLGIDMYTGKPIPLECILEDDDEYDCDHIIPKSIKIDNSPQNNLVLTARDTNIKKDKYYPLNQVFDQNQLDKVHPLWAKLKKSKLITAEKYQRLIRTEPLSSKEKADFISRQIVEIGQNVKVLADILRASLKNTNVIFVKSNNIADFRQIFKIPKCRMINEYHHAHDAYLTEVVGSVFTAKFTQNPLNFIYSKEPYNISKMYDKHVVRGKFVYWFPSKKDDEGNYIPSPGSTYEKVLKNLTESSEPMFFRVPYTTKGKLFNTNIVGKNEISNPNLYMPIKKNNPKLTDVTKYGGYGNIKGAYFFIVEHTDKKKRVQTIEQVYVHELKALNEGKISLLDICKRRGLKLPMIINPKILPGSKFGPGYISGRSGSSILFHNAKQYNFPLDDIEYLSKVEKKKLKYLTKDKNEKMYDKFVKVLKEHGYVEIYSKKVLDVVFNGKERFNNLTLEDQCTVLQQIAAFFQVGSTNISLKLIGGSANTGKIQRSRVLASNI